MNSDPVPAALRKWFVAHFWADILFAIPLMLLPLEMLSILGWQSPDAYTARLVAAALFGIGIESWLGRNAGIESFRNMLNLKIIWSFSAVLGIAVSLAQGAQNAPLFAWVILAIFAGFNLLWVYWRVKLTIPNL
ncbi:MAG: hypothetical protein JW757_12665 [Anaerolineales bacterium]|nr:hypothetical protein [Anaerolineales bacterium]